MSIKVSLSDKSILDNKVDAAVFCVEQGFDFSKNFKDLEKKYCSGLEKLMKDRKFDGKVNSIFVTPAFDANFSYMVFLGIGKKTNKTINFENYRRALGRLVKTLPSYSIKSIALQLPEASLFNVASDYIVKNSAITLLMADYIFDIFITDREESKINVNLIVNSKEVKKLQSALYEGILIGSAVNEARTWVDLPANKLTPGDLASHAEKIAKDTGLKCKVFHEKEINKMGMGGLSAVSRGSDLDCCLAIIEYKAPVKTAETICIVGKGITFDSGGLSLKPALGMETMKEDMSGAAAVIATMKVIGQLKPNVNVIALAPIAENLPSGNAIKPGDIVTFYNGMTAEIKNTDAEGRLILADALSYAVKHYKPDHIIDLATLTGACAYALGPFFSGLFSEHEDFTKRVQEAAQKSGDYVWRMPLTDDYKVAVKCEVADLCNIGKKQYMAGGTTAACFLQPFVGETSWVHLDIAGAAFNVPDISYYRPSSATGVGVRLLVELLMSWK